MKKFFKFMHGKDVGEKAELAASKFDDDEIHVLKMTWSDLADRSGEKGIDKDNFLQYFPLGGLLGERLFAQFDVAGNHIIDFDEFIIGLSVMCRGTMDEKIHFIFNMYDSMNEGSVSKVELTTLLNHIPREFFARYEKQQAAKNGHTPPPGSDLSRVASRDSIQDMHHHHGSNSNRNSQGTNTGPPSETGSDSGHSEVAAAISGEHQGHGAPAAAPAVTVVQQPEVDEDYADLDHYTHHDMIEKAFAECDLNHEERLSFPEFKMWMQRTTMVLEYIESIFPYSGPKDFNKHKHRQETLPHMKRIVSQSFRNPNSIHDAAGEVFKDTVSPRGQGGNNFSFSRNNSMQRIASQRGQSGGMSGSNASMDSLSFPTPLSTPSGRPPSMNAFNFHSPAAPNNSAAGASAGSGGHHRNESTSSQGIAVGGGGGGGAAVATVGDNGTLTPPLNTLVRSPSGMGDSVMGDNPEETARNLIIQALEITQEASLRLSLMKVLEDHYGPEGALGGGAAGAYGHNSDMFAHPTEEDVYREVVSMESYLWKKGKSMLHSLVKRFYVLSGNCAYYYHHKNDVRPQGVIFLTGSIVSAIDDTAMALKGYYGFEVTHQDLCSGKHHNHEKRVLYAKTEQEREDWVTALQHAAHVVPVEDDYVIGKELGRGRFSVVRECCNKDTGLHFAVKVIDKTTIEPEEKSLLRTEIAVLKLVNHPNIIHMEGLYETKSHLYIVMEMLKGGELFERIVGRPRFTELEAAKLLRPLLESVAYLHDLGIVHRDLKPENILCGEQLDDLKIADFGLSKMILPQEKMDSACGTLSYVAPEVLTLQGYGKEADLWSVGVILFLLLCGKLPFDGDTTDEIIKSTIQADLKVNPQVWSKLGEDARNLIKSLLHKSAKERITARAALKHPFITTHVGRHLRGLSNPQNPQSNLPSGASTPKAGAAAAAVALDHAAVAAEVAAMEAGNNK